MGFYRSNDPTNSVKALKEDKSEGLGFNPIRSTPTVLTMIDLTMQYETKKTQIHTNTNKSTHSETGPV